MSLSLWRSFLSFFLNKTVIFSLIFFVPDALLFRHLEALNKKKRISRPGRLIAIGIKIDSFAFLYPIFGVFSPSSKFIKLVVVLSLCALVAPGNDVKCVRSTETHELPHQQGVHKLITAKPQQQRIGDIYFYCWRLWIVQIDFNCVESLRHVVKNISKLNWL